MAVWLLLMTGVAGCHSGVAAFLPRAELVACGGTTTLYSNGSAVQGRTARDSGLLFRLEFRPAVAMARLNDLAGVE
ncbi:MAG: hypothetical protein D6806_05735, partial [Deltaproteobacteria bacterium]